MLDFDSGIMRFKKVNGGLESLVGWTVHAPRVTVGTVVEILMPAGKRSIHQTLLRTEKSTELISPSYRGVELHLIPLVEAYVHAFDEERKMVMTQLPQGFMSLGKRKLILSHLEKELGLLSSEKEMPSRAQLIEMGRSDLLELIAKAGGFSSTASELGLKWRGKRRNGYWDDPSNLDLEIADLINSSWIDMGGYYVNSMTKQMGKKPMLERGSKRFMPPVGALQAAGRWDIYQQIVGLGGVKAVSEMLGRRRVTRAGRQAIVATRDELMQEITSFMKGMEEEADGDKPTSVRSRLPTESELHRAGRSEIVHGIKRLVGGFGRLAEEEGMRTARWPRSHWRNIDNVVNEVKSFVAERDRELAAEDDSEEKGKRPDLLPPKFPTQVELKAKGRDDLIYGIRLHGHSLICSKCDMRKEGRGIKKGLLKLALIETLLDEASSPLSLVQFKEKLGLKGISVTRQHLFSFLTNRAKEGRLVKVSRGLWSKSLPPQSNDEPSNQP